MTADEMSFLRLSNIAKNFGDVEAVSDLTLDIHEGEVFTLLGPSGCGKSTTLRMIAGLEHPNAGTITLKGRQIVDAQAGRFATPESRNMGMVFQSYAIWPHMKVFDNVAFPLRIRHHKRGDIRNQVMKALELVDLADWADSYPWQLSGGMQQRVALARAIVYSPDVLLLDEPLSNLDAKLREQMRSELKALQRKLETCFVFVTHDQAEAMVLSNRIAVLNEGRLEQVGTPAEVYETPATPFVRDFLGQSVLFAGTIRNGQGRLWIDLDLGARVPLPCAGDGLVDGNKVTLACRAESVRLQPAATAGDHDIRAMIEDTTYVGDRMEYAIRAGDKLLSLHCYDQQRLDPGAEVAISFGDRGITVWPDGG
ncbi:MAG: ABC transporter ATP-binding protein [Rhodospirillales bacterium]|nr:ABC transporter ATP-binding protein [Rhodospirillales bacterium]